MDKPKLIFKYRSASTDKDFQRLEEIFRNKELYIPTVSQINDPFEGKINVGFGIAGSSITRALDNDFLPVRNAKKKTRLLALSEDCFSPQLWAYYCNDYKGVCLCFKTDSHFSSIEPVNYPEHLDAGEVIIEPSENELYALLRERLLEKQEGWKHEREWRMIFQPTIINEWTLMDDAQKKLSFDDGELVAVIIGNNISEKDMNRLKSFIPNHIKLFKVHTGALSGKVELLEDDYIYRGYGKPDYICTVDELYDRIFAE